MGRSRKHKPTHEELAFRNAQAASIIIEHAAEYGDASLAVQWARLWTAKHNLEKALDGWHPIEPTLHDWNVAANQMEEEKQQVRRQKSIDKRRARWALQNWRVSRRGNFYTKYKNWFILCFLSRSGWIVRISDNVTEEKKYFNHSSCENAEKAMAAAFDDLLMMEARNSVDPRFMQLHLK